MMEIPIFYEFPICQYSRRRPNSHYKCHYEDCKHHISNMPTGPKAPESFYEWNPFGKNVEKKCPYYQSKAQMIVQNKRRYENERQYL